MKKLISSAAFALVMTAMANAEMANAWQDRPESPVARTPSNTASTDGPYLGFQAGFNTFQDTMAAGDTSGAGGVGGLKAGCIFPNGDAVFRPVLEADFFYNGYNQTVHGFKTTTDSGAFMGNFLFRFDADQFQPYLGGGIGVFCKKDISNGNADDDAGFAWQIVAGGDFCVNPKVWVFAEYKFLNYQDIQQHLIVVGVRLPY